LLAIFISTITSLFFIGLGLLSGTLFSDKAVGGICGALVTNLAGWLSGVFIPLDLIGGGFKTFCKVFPFYHSVEAIKSALVGDFAGIFPHLGVTLAYSLVIFVVAIFIFKQKMRGKE
jgi:ABC-2 type transport system permease protein